MRILVQVLVVLLPWSIKRRLLQGLFGYNLHPTSHIGLAWIFPSKLTMKEGAAIGHLTVCKGLDSLVLGEQALIGRLNWITAFPLGLEPHFSHLTNRACELILGDQAAITNRHIIDCTERISIGRYTTLAGFRSQILTHSIDLALNRQDAKPIIIGEYCFVGTACTMLGGSVLPDFCVLGANSLLNKPLHDRYRLYAGVPARAVEQLDEGMGYFHRSAGYVI